MKIIIQTTFVL